MDGPFLGPDPGASARELEELEEVFRRDPFLSKIPFIGRLFGGRDFNEEDLSSRE